MHREIEELLRNLAQATLMAKGITGLEEVDVKAEENQAFLQQAQQKVLQGILASMPVPVRAGMTGVELKSVTWKAEGIHFMWEIHVIGANINLEHTINTDQRDITNAKIGESLGTKLHELRQRLSSLEHCSTNSEVEECVETIECTGDEGLCVICQCDLEHGEAGSKLRACGHTYHPECIDGWLLACKRECPICKEPPGAEKPSSQGMSRDVHARTAAVGTRIQVRGLQSRQDLNGRPGQVVQWMEARGRYKVLLDMIQDEVEAPVVFVKPNNLLLEDTSEAHAIGESSATEMSEGTEVSEATEVSESASNTDEDDGLSNDENEDLAAAIAMSLGDSTLADTRAQRMARESQLLEEIMEEMLQHQ